MINRYLVQIRTAPTAVALIALLLIGMPVLAQEAPPPGGEAATTVTEPEAPPVLSSADINLRADKVSVNLVETKKAVDAIPPDVAEIPERLDGLEADLDALLKPIGPDGFTDLRRYEVEALLQKFNRMNRDLETWRGQLQQRADQLDTLNQASKIDQGYFQSVLNDENADDLPDALLDRIGNTIEKLDATRQKIRDQLDIRLASLERISTDQLRISEAMRPLEASMQQRERDMLSFDREPIWEMKPEEEPLRARLSRELLSRTGSVFEYYKANEGRLIVALILLVVIVALSVSLRPKIVDLNEEPAAETNQQPILKHPIAVGTLLWAILVPEFLLPPLPLGLGIIRLLLIVASLWRILSAIAPPAQMKSLAGLLGLTALSGLLELVQQTDYSDRISLLFVAATGAYLFRRIRLEARESRHPDATLWWRIGYGVTAVAPVVLIACMIAVSLGAVSFAQLNVVGILFLFTVVLTVLIAEGVLNAIARAFVNGPGQNWLRSIRRYPDLTHRRLSLLIRVLMLFIFINAVPKIYPVLQIVYEQLIAALTFEFTMGTVNVSIGDVLGLLAGVVLAVYVAKFIRFTLDEDVFPRLPIATGKAAAASRLIYYALVAGGILFALAAGGIELNKLTLIISALGVGIGFGLQGIVNNFVSGLVLAFERPFSAGDIIAVETLTGRVREIGLRASRVRTFDGAEVIVPNADLIAGNVINWTLSDRMRRLDIRIGVAYGTDPGRVKEILLAVASENEVVAKDPEPVSLFEGFGDSSLNFTLRIWIPEAGDWPQRSSDLYTAVHDAIISAGIEIPFPQRTLHIRNDSA